MLLVVFCTVGTSVVNSVVLFPLFFGTIVKDSEYLTIVLILGDKFIMFYLTFTKCYIQICGWKNANCHNYGEQKRNIYAVWCIAILANYLKQINKERKCR